MSKPKMTRKITPYGPLYEKRVKELARTYMIIYPCKTCGSPVNSGYVCVFCDDDNPSEKE